MHKEPTSMDYRHYWDLSRGVSYESLETRDGIGHFDKSENSGNLKNNAQLTHICSDMCRVGQLGTFILTGGYTYSEYPHFEHTHFDYQQCA